MHDIDRVEIPVTDSDRVAGLVTCQRSIGFSGDRQLAEVGPDDAVEEVVLNRAQRFFAARRRSAAF